MLNMLHSPLQKQVQGRFWKIITVAPGSKQISVDAGVLSNGAYTYALMVDGKKIDSRQMAVRKQSLLLHAVVFSLTSN